MRLGILSWFTLLFLLPGCSTPDRVSAHGKAAATAPEPYVRIENTDSNLVRLQIAFRKFLPAHHKGPALWLAGVSHVGESNYYAMVQQQLDAQTLVLFEGVTGVASGSATDDQTMPPAAPGVGPETATAVRGGESSLQTSMAAALGLVFQLEAIDYSRRNFRHCDLSVAQIRDLIAEQPPVSGEAGAGESFEGLLELMQGSSWFDPLVRFALRFVGANPKLQGLARLALIDTLDEIQGDPSRLDGLPPEMKQLLDVLVQKRNQKVITSLKTELEKLGRQDSIAVFYGTGHMPDLEQRVREELHYRPAGQLWLTAFAVDLARTRITSSERAFVRDFLKSQLGISSVQPRK